MTIALRCAMMPPYMENKDMNNSKPVKRETLNLRIKSDDRNLIDRAAKALGQTRTDFVLQAARHAAEDALLDRTFLSVDAGAYAEFLERLDAPAAPNKRLVRAMQTPKPW